MSLFQADGLTGGIAHRFRLGIAVLCAVILMIMMGLTVADVLGRYLLTAPVPGATELTELLLAAVVFLGLPAAGLDGDHIAVDVLTSRLSAIRAKFLAIFVALLSTGILAVIAWRLWMIGVQIGGYGGTTPTLKLPIAPVAYGVSLLCVLAAVITLLHGIAQWRQTRQQTEGQTDG
jgi:TRAP-type C4-dicarboxylate transport system permease small subunit